MFTACGIDLIERHLSMLSFVIDESSAVIILDIPTRTKDWRETAQATMDAQEIVKRSQNQQRYLTSFHYDSPRVLTSTICVRWIVLIHFTAFVTLPLASLISRYWYMIWVVPSLMQVDRIKTLSMHSSMRSFSAAQLNWYRILEDKSLSNVLVVHFKSSTSYCE